MPVLLSLARLACPLPRQQIRKLGTRQRQASEAIHAIAMGRSDHIRDLFHGVEPKPDPNAPHFAALDRLTPGSGAAPVITVRRNEPQHDHAAHSLDDAGRDCFAEFILGPRGARTGGSQ